MSPPARNRNLHAARAAKKNEFYTQLNVIAAELAHYKPHFAGKVIYCNCDDPRNATGKPANGRPAGSWFYYYFKDQFADLGLKELIAATYRQPELDHRRMQADLDDEAEELTNPPAEFKPRDAVYVRYTGNGNGRTGRPHKMQGDNGYHGGDFRSQESIALLKQADIVVTNPPFSLFREFVAQLIAHDKKFVILGPMNAISYKEIFPLIKNNQIWAGVHNGPKEFTCPPWADKFHEEKDGDKIMKMGNVYWYTNLEHHRRSRGLDYLIHMDENQANGVAYPKYDNYDAIEVSKVDYIPDDYPGVMGVPITFLDRFNPEQFEIIGVTNTVGLDGGVFTGGSEKHKWINQIDGKTIYRRLLIKHRNPATPAE